MAKVEGGRVLRCLYPTPLFLPIMHYYLITGASQGLGRALAEAILVRPDTWVLGISRHATIEHSRYQHQPLDLSDIEAVEHNLAKIFLPRPDAQSLTLINNAGTLGEIGYAGELPNEHFQFVFDLNVVAPAMLMNTFLDAYSSLIGIPRTILNISSGAAQRSVDGWAAYCASKATLNSLSETIRKSKTREVLRYAFGRFHRELLILLCKHTFVRLIQRSLVSRRNSQIFTIMVSYKKLLR
jgi:NAD(P)-dependent dehydrogenase (short-subunit alcohol dehydrogenase family)